MGTSINQRSPRTSNWKIIEMSYKNKNFPIDRLTQELCRAAINQQEGNIFRDLSAQTISKCISIISISNDRYDAIQKIRKEVLASGNISLACDIAQRSVIPAFNAPSNITQTYIVSLFSEVANYLVSRDLPGNIGLGRVNNVSEAIVFKNEIKNTIAKKVAEIPFPSNQYKDTKAWSAFVNDVVNHLTKGN
jgi:hypothetical protein